MMSQIAKRGLFKINSILRDGGRKIPKQARKPFTIILCSLELKPNGFPILVQSKIDLQLCHPEPRHEVKDLRELARDSFRRGGQSPSE